MCSPRAASILSVDADRPQVGAVGLVVLTGGDWMEAGRFLVPFLAVVGIIELVGVIERLQDGEIRTIEVRERVMEKNDELAREIEKLREEEK